jgi:tetratricopeptide repeat protein
VERAWTADRTRTSLALTLAGLYLKKNDYARARTVLARARQESRDEDLRFLCGHLLGRIAEVTAVTAEVQGTLASLRCLPGGALRFVIESAGRSLHLHADSPQAVLLYDASGQPLQKTLVCGRQGLSVTAWYRTTPESRPTGADGTVLSLTFQDRPVNR